MTTTDHPLFSRRITNRRKATMIVDTSRGELRVQASSVGAAVKQAQRKLARPLVILGVREG